MSDPYEEIVNGQTVLRLPPRARHEEILARLHQGVAQATRSLVTTKLLQARTRLELSLTNIFRPDLALVTTASDKLWLVAEVINSDDHHADTVDKKSVYEEIKLPRLCEALLPGFQYAVHELFAGNSAAEPGRFDF